MLACARIGAVFSVVFAGFSPEALAGPDQRRRERLRHHRRPGPPRRHDGRAQSERGRRARSSRAGRPPRPRRPEHGRQHHLEREPRRVAPRGAGGRSTPTVPCARWTPRTRSSSSTPPARRARRRASSTRPAATASGRSITHELVFDLHDDDVFWCTADVGWITGHSLHRLRPAHQRRHAGVLRGRPNLPRRRPLLGGRRQARRHDLLHRAHGDPRPHGEGRRASSPAPTAPASACSGPSASRSTRRRGGGTTRPSATGAARSSTRGGRRRRAAS